MTTKATRSFKRGDRVHKKRMHTAYTVVAETEGGDYWIIDADYLKRHGGLVCNGATGEPWESSIMSQPVLAERNNLESA